jgi:type III restriction enzyme
MEGIVDSLKEELRIYKGDDDAEDFEPFQIKEERKKEPKIPLRAGVGSLSVPRLQLELPSVDHLEKLLKKKTYDFTVEDRAAPGRALISIVSVKTGDVVHQERDLLEDMRSPCGRYLQEQIRVLSKSCLNSMNPALFSNEKLDKTACFGSKALLHYRGLALDLVREYENHVRLALLADPEEQSYTVKPYQPSGAIHKDFQHSAHPYYDSKAFANNDESDMAKALDKFEHAWARNKDRLDYGIPLPLKSASSSTFYPDFLWWVNGTVWAIDPTGKHILDEKIRTKLLSVPHPLRIALVTRGKLDTTFKRIGEDGWTLVRLRLGNASPETFETLSDLLSDLVDETVGAVPPTTT